MKNPLLKAFFAISGVLLLFYLFLHAADKSNEPKAIEIDCSSVSNLNHFSDNQLTEALFRYLASSGAWHLTKEGGVDVATYKRRYGVQTPSLVNSSNPLQLYIYFSPLSGKYWENPLSRAAVVEAGKSGQLIRLESPPDTTEGLGMGSDILVKSTGPWLHLIEWNIKPERELTAQGLKEVSKILETVEKNKTKILEGNYQDILPKGSFIESEKDTIAIREGSQRGLYIVSGFVNPSEKGYITVHVYSVVDGKPSTKEIARKAMEYVGYSPNSKVRFLYQVEIQIDEGDNHEKSPAQFEVWFQPSSDKDKKRKLVEQYFGVYSWER